MTTQSRRCDHSHWGIPWPSESLWGHTQWPVHKAESGQIWGTRPQPSYFQASLPMKEKLKLTIYSWIDNITAIHTFLLLTQTHLQEGHLNQTPWASSGPRQHHCSQLSKAPECHVFSLRRSTRAHSCVSRESTVRKKDLSCDLTEPSKGSGHFSTSLNYFQRLFHCRLPPAALRECLF